MGYGKENMAFDPIWDAAHLDRTYSLIERDKNHPSEIIWSLGNEASNGDVFKKTYQWIKERDQSRPVQYERAEEHKATDIVCPMYATIERIAAYAQKPEIQAGDITVIFNTDLNPNESHKTGLQQYTKNGKQVLKDAVQPNFWRAPTDNDFGTQIQRKLSVWRAAGYNRLLKNVEIKEGNNSITVIFNYRLPDVEADYVQSYTVRADGSILSDISYTTENKDLIEIPRFGSVITLPITFDNYVYYGHGPVEN